MEKDRMDVYNKIQKKFHDYPPVHGMSTQELGEYQREIGRYLRDNQIQFCKNYVVGETIGNAIRSYANAYDKDMDEDESDYYACKNGSYRLMRNQLVLEYINLLIYKAGFHPSSVDAQLLYLINQHNDFASKLGAIKEYNKLAGRITDKMEVQGQIDTGRSIDYSNLSDDEVETLITLIQKAQKNKEVGEQIN